MSSDLANINTDQSHTYQLQLKGSLHSPSIDWCGEISVVPQEDGGILIVSLIVDRADLHTLLDQFRNLNLMLLPIENELQTGDALDSPRWITTGTSLPEQALLDSEED